MYTLSEIDRPMSTTDRPTQHMNPSSNDAYLLSSVLRPENALEGHLLNLPDFQRGLFWGEPRFGHPEGKVVFHVREVLDNIDRIPMLPHLERVRLRLVAFAHDTFKYEEDRSRPRNWAKHHAQLARQFLSQFTDDQVVLDILETHDDAFYAWLASRIDASNTLTPTHPVKTLESLLNQMGYCMQTYYLFFKCDTQTGDKTQAPLKWFESNVPDIHLVPVRERMRGRR
jgi:hypothetical protein